MKRILCPAGCRSDEGLSAPVIRRLKEADWCEVKTIQLSAQNFGESYQYVRDWLYWHPTDLVFVTGDRVEMCAAAAAAFHSKVKIAHFYAGVVNDPITTFDDVDRHCITLWSDIQFCENADAAEIALSLKSDILYANSERTSIQDIHVVGISHLDDLEVDESKVPAEPYDLVLMNSPSLVDEVTKYEGGPCIVHIGSNPDGIIRKLENARYYDNLPRPQFLGLLKNCQRFITNSSAAIYEAPHFLAPEQIVMVGDRNRNRPRGPFETGASDKIVAILREYLGNDKPGPLAGMNVRPDTIADEKLRERREWLK